MGAVVVFHQQVPVGGLLAVDDFGKAIVVFGGFDKQLVIIAPGGRIGAGGLGFEENRELQWRKDLAGPGGQQFRNAGRVSPDKGLICIRSIQLLAVVAVRGQINIQPAAIGEVSGVNG